MGCAVGLPGDDEVSRTGGGHELGVRWRVTADYSDYTDAMHRPLSRSDQATGDAAMEETPAGLGATRDELRRLLGEPSDTSVPSRRHRRGAIWRYGEVEYHFGSDGRVWMIYTEDANGNPRVLGQITKLYEGQAFEGVRRTPRTAPRVHKSLA